MISSEASLLAQLKDLGVRPRSVLFVHSSFKSLGPVSGGAETVIRALEAAISPGGLLLMPSFNLEGGANERSKSWNVDEIPSTVGWLTEYLRQMSGTFRSDHYSHSVAARGEGAEAFVADHLRTDGMRSPWDLEPWGKTYGTHSPMTRAYDTDGKILMLGVDYETSTYVHYVETTLWNARIEGDPDARYPWIFRVKTGAYWESVGRMNRAYVGLAYCRLFSIQDYVDTLVAEYERDYSLYTRKPAAT